MYANFAKVTKINIQNNASFSQSTKNGTHKNKKNPKYVETIHNLYTGDTHALLSKTVRFRVLKNTNYCIVLVS